MEEHERTDIEPTDEYFEESGCGPILLVLGVIAAFWIAVGCIFLFT